MLVMLFGRTVEDKDGVQKLEAEVQVLQDIIHELLENCAAFLKL
jgi:hypothetical protein